MVECRVCGQEMKWIQNTHLKKHDMTLEQYRKLYPDAPNKDKEMVETLKKTRWGNYKVPTKKCANPSCNNMVHYKNKYCSYACNGKDNSINYLGKYATKEGNPNYKGGEYSYCRDQKRLAFQRDKGTCQKCQKKLDGKQVRYGVHHIVPRRLFENKEEADSLENLTTLCSSCHRYIESEFTLFIFELYKTKRYLEVSQMITEIKEKYCI